ncbi:MAG: 50S ribosomal protein L9 [Puniceicoccales bacterium]|jgi:large subunit ribosomal protein L9|nr:50S ribosomal protein L9 [Puniceicoccales bacterium]
MATADILLLQKIDHLGYEGDEVTVRAGYARNYLLPKRLAIPITRSNRKQIDALRIRRREREAKELQEAKELAEKIRNLMISFSVKTGERGKMFGAVTAADLARKFAENGIAIDRKKIHLDPVKHTGQCTAKIKLHHEITIDFTFDVVAEGVAARPGT